ncbi:MAG: DUF58 domain-containing protein [Vulcanisaeta sp.]
MSSAIKYNRSLIIYVLIASLMYLGIYIKNALLTFVGINLFLVFTSYLLTWDLLTSLSLSLLDINDELMVMKDHVILRIRAKSSLPLKIPAKITLICSPHLQCSNIDRDLIINGKQKDLDLEIKWFGIAKVLGIIIKVVDPMGIVTNAAFIRLGHDIVIEPKENVKLIIGKGFNRDLGDAVVFQSRTGDFVTLKEYDFSEPVSSIHWITSARVGNLVSTVRSEMGNLPKLIIMEYTPHMLKPANKYRPIDEALMYLRGLRGIGALLILIGNDIIKVMNLSRVASLADLELRLRMLVIGMEGREELLERAKRLIGNYVNKLSNDDLMTWLYPINVSKGLSDDEIKVLTRYLRKDSLLILSKESLSSLIRSNVDLNGAQVIVVGEGV